MPAITVKSLGFFNDALTLQLDQPDGWQKGAVGINSAINLFAVAEGALFTDMPDTLGRINQPQPKSSGW